VAGSPEKKMLDEDVVRTRMSGDEEIDLEIIELLFFAYRDFISDPDAMLAKSGFGRAHHRVVHFVNREPGMTVADLLDTLNITKQSLARVLKQLIDSGYITQLEGPDDRRQRRLYPTRAGRMLALDLARPQSRRIENAFGRDQDTMRAAVVRFLNGMRDKGGKE
jgi:DNA-binding MarR family transcriptional regulator